MLSSLCFLVFAADSLGRRKSLLVSSVGQAATLYVIGVYQKLYPGTISWVGDHYSSQQRVYATDDDQIDPSLRIYGDRLRLLIRLVSIDNAALAGH